MSCSIPSIHSGMKTRANLFKNRSTGVARRAQCALVLINLLSSAHAEERQTGPSDHPRIVTVYLSNIVIIHPFVRARAQTAVENVFLRAGVRIIFRAGTWDGRGVGRFLVVDLKTDTPPNTFAGALGYSFPFEGIHMAAFCDRIGTKSDKSFGPVFLGYVIAHEIGHLLARSDMHSESGIMKANWSRADFAQMRLGKLHFTSLDIDVIQQGMAIESPKYSVSMAYTY
jgi:hypothetical protein